MKKVPMLDLRAEYEYMKADIDAALGRCLDHQKWILGPEVGDLEEKIGDYLGVKHCIGVSSGTDALVLSLRAMALKTRGEEYFSRDDLVITSPFTFTATGDAILRAGATPLFADIDPSTCNIDANKISQIFAPASDLSSRVAGIVPVHLYGQSCDMDAIMKIANENGFFVVEDVAQAFGGKWKNRMLGSLGSAGAFSFFPSKNLGGFGDGGMVSTDDDEIAGLVRMLLKHGGRDKYNVDHIGYNARLDTIQAAVLLAKLRYIDEFNRRRKAIAGIYDEALDGIADLLLPACLDDADHVYHQYTVRTSRRDGLMAFVKEEGISSMIYYPVALHKMTVFQGNCIAADDLSHAEMACESVLSLPVEPLQTEDDVRYVAETVRDYLRK